MSPIKVQKADQQLIVSWDEPDGHTGDGQSSWKLEAGDCADDEKLPGALAVHGFTPFGDPDDNTYVNPTEAARYLQGHEKETDPDAPEEQEPTESDRLKARAGSGQGMAARNPELPKPAGAEKPDEPPHAEKASTTKK